MPVSRGHAAKSRRLRHPQVRVAGRLLFTEASPIIRRGARGNMASGRQNSGGVADERDQFIPVRKADILHALIDDGRLPDGEAEKFRLLCRLLGAIYHYEYFDRLETLRNDYYYFNPDLPHDTPVAATVLAQAHDELVATLVGVLRSANFVEVAPEDVERSHRERHFLKVA